MAVFTELTKHQISNAIRSYKLDSIQSIKGFASGVENTTYGPICGDERHVLTLFERRVSAKDIPFFADLLEELRNGGINCPKILANDSGKNHFFINGKLCILQTFIKGMVVDLPTPYHCKLAGQQLGQMHCIGSESKLRKQNPLSIKNWADLLPTALAHQSSQWQSRAVQINELYNTLRREWPEGLPTGPVHADYFPDNVFFIGETSIAVFDFFLACSETFAYDLALALISWAFDDDGDISPDHMIAFLFGYKQTYSMSKNEQKWLPFFCKAAALRILLTRMVDDQVSRNSVQVSNKPPEPFWRRLVTLREAEFGGHFKQFLKGM